MSKPADAPVLTTETTEATEKRSERGGACVPHAGRAVRPPEKIGRGLYASPGGSCVYDWSPNEVRVPCGAILSVAFAVVVNPCFLLLAPRSLLPAPCSEISNIFG